MPRDANGNYTLPLPPVVSGTTIDTAWANPTMADLANGLSGSLSRLGAGGMLSELNLIDGAVGSPGIGFNTEPTLGIYRLSAQDAGFAVGGVQMGGWSPAYQIYVQRDYGGGAQKYAVADTFNAFTQKYGGFNANQRHDAYAGDLDDIVTNSRYAFSSIDVSNDPVDFDPAGWGFVQTMMWSTDDTAGTQVIYGMDGTNVYRQWTRQRAGGVWPAAWKKVVDQGAFTTRLLGYHDDFRHLDYSGNLDEIVYNSKMYIVAGTVTNEPVGFGDTGFILTMVSTDSTGEATQVLYGQGTISSKLMWMRSRIGGVWNDWELVTGNISGVGAIFQFPGLTIAPAAQGMTEAAGQLLSRADAPILFALVQANGGLLTDAEWVAKSNGGANGVGYYSDGNGSSTFRIPDLRGEFMRAMADAATNGRDPDRTDNSREWQGSANLSHVHTYTLVNNGNTSPGGAFPIPLIQGGDTGASGGNEARGRNIPVLTCIKVEPQGAFI